MAADRPSPPGSRPSALHFPFDEARRAAAEARELASDVRRLGRLLGQDLGALGSGSFAGLFADWLAAAGDDAHQELLVRANALEDQADQIESTTMHARGRVSDRQDQVMRWEQRYRQWRDWKEPVRAERA